jgi:hypothetical protein
MNIRPISIKHYEEVDHFIHLSYAVLDKQFIKILTILQTSFLKEEWHQAISHASN